MKGCEEGPDATSHSCANPGGESEREEKKKIVALNASLMTSPMAPPSPSGLRQCHSRCRKYHRCRNQSDGLDKL